MRGGLRLSVSLQRLGRRIRPLRFRDKALRARISVLRRIKRLRLQIAGLIQSGREADRDGHDFMRFPKCPYFYK